MPNFGITFPSFLTKIASKLAIDPTFVFSPVFLSWAVIVQYSCGIKFSISFSRSTTKRTATDWTRPAERPLATFFHKKGDNL